MKEKVDGMELVREFAGVGGGNWGVAGNGVVGRQGGGNERPSGGTAGVRLGGRGCLRRGRHLAPSGRS
ncbi:hypothetical protein P7K49_033534 [Saguinus oedipus]|uniref:Uncharacterized protein n=1 Tax=Saguinus oedipus TaxID=9490 RepID=A0ABQ9TS77_SAGOE|nr:hypothetical protein P7K49_033534 [Saguinus oedipus]